MTDQFIDGTDPNAIKDDLLRRPHKIESDPNGPTPNEVAAGLAPPTVDEDEQQPSTIDEQAAQAQPVEPATA